MQCYINANSTLAHRIVVWIWKQERRGWKPNLICHVHASSFQIDSTFSFWAAFPWESQLHAAMIFWQLWLLPENCCCCCCACVSTSLSFCVPSLCVFALSRCCWNAVLNLITPLLSAGRLNEKPLAAESCNVLSLILLAGRVLCKLNTHRPALGSHRADLFSRP